MKVIHNVPLAQYTSLHAGGSAVTLVELEEGDDLVQTLSDRQPPLWVLGFGTNCLISDKGLPGTVILDRVGKLDRLSPTSFKVDSGYNWDKFVQAAIRENLWGIEFASGIPGNMGAAVAGNIAAYGHKLAEVFVEAEVLDVSSGNTVTWDKNMFGFEYRSSVLQKPENAKYIIINATINLSARPTAELEYDSALAVAKELGINPDSLLNRRQIIIETRRRAGSLLQSNAVGPWTAGSFFKNPLVDEEQIETILNYEERGVSREQLLRQNVIHGENKRRVSAAHVLLAAGFKRGQVWGNVRLHPEHILKVENLGEASAQEIYEVVQNILATVRGKLGIELEPEVRFLGEF